MDLPREEAVAGKQESAMNVPAELDKHGQDTNDGTVKPEQQEQGENEKGPEPPQIDEISRSLAALVLDESLLYVNGVHFRPEMADRGLNEVEPSIGMPDATDSMVSTLFTDACPCGEVNDDGEGLDLPSYEEDEVDTDDDMIPLLELMKDAGLPESGDDM